MPAYHHSFFTGQMPFLPPSQQCQSTEGKHTEAEKARLFKKFLKAGENC